MLTVAFAGHAPAAIDLNQPGSYLHWNVFTISVANLVLIAVMVAIFGAALLLPFPGRRSPPRPTRRRTRPERTQPDRARMRRPRAMSGCGRRGCAAA